MKKRTRLDTQQRHTRTCYNNTHTCYTYMLYNWRAKRAYLVVRMARFFYIYIYIYVGTAHTVLVRMREMFSRKMVQRSPFGPSRQR